MRKTLKMTNKGFIKYNFAISKQKTRRVNSYFEITFDHELTFRTVSEVICSFSRMLKFSRSQTSNLAGFLDDEEFMAVVEETAHREKEIDVSLLARKIEILYNLINNENIDYIDIRDIFSTSEEKVIKAEMLLYNKNERHEIKRTEGQLPCLATKDVFFVKNDPIPFREYKVFNISGGNNER